MKGRLADLALAALAIGQLAAAAWLTPAGDAVALPGGSPLGGTCWFHEVFGLPCPFCGMTRSFVALAHGRIGDAFRFHAAGPLLAAAMVVFVAAVAIAWVRRARPMFYRRGFAVSFQIVAMVCVATGIIQMARS
ncbi:MAG TPA: DUF2752 domain-containing protein [Kofleriaceae bacterium]|nr:DUF2752 domain-containing protein [Kofleriaceae bacterium]